jgi:hypothetical protein
MNASKLITPVALALLLGLGAAASADDLGCHRRTDDDYSSYWRQYRHRDYVRATRYYDDDGDADYYYDRPYYRPSGYAIYRRYYRPSYHRRYYYDRYDTHRPRVGVDVRFGF